MDVVTSDARGVRGFTMFKSLAARFITAVAAAALVAGVTVFLTPAAPDARAELKVQSTVNPPLAKDDHLPVRVTGPACSLRGWPHYEQSCLFDSRHPADEMRKVRVIALR